MSAIPLGTAIRGAMDAATDTVEFDTDAFEESLDAHGWVITPKVLDEARRNAIVAAGVSAVVYDHNDTPTLDAVAFYRVLIARGFRIVGDDDA